MKTEAILFGLIRLRAVCWLSTFLVVLESFVLSDRTWGLYNSQRYRYLTMANDKLLNRSAVDW